MFFSSFPLSFIVGHTHACISLKYKLLYDLTETDLEIFPEVSSFLQHTTIACSRYYKIFLTQ